jgi:hypothetical protein
MKKPDPTLIKIRDIWVKYHYVRKEYFENPKRLRLRRYRKDGVPLGRGCVDAPGIHRENIAEAAN